MRVAESIRSEGKTGVQIGQALCTGLLILLQVRLRMQCMLQKHRNAAFILCILKHRPVYTQSYLGYTLTTGAHTPSLTKAHAFSTLPPGL
jgi:hypothetical protein